MRSFIAAILAVLCLVALVSGDCLPRLDSSFFDDSTGTSNVETVQGTNTLPVSGAGARCQGVLKDFVNQTICCSAATLDKIEAIANNIDGAVTAVEQKFASDIQGLDLLGPNSTLTEQQQQEINSYPKLQNLLNQVDGALDQFRARAPGDFSKCVRTLETYLAGALCSICRPDFIPEVLEISNATGVVVRTWKWKVATCDALAAGCTPLFSDLDNLMTTIYDAIVSTFSDPQIKNLLKGDGFVAEFPDRDAIRPCVIAAREIDGNNTNVASACRTLICRGVARGLRRPKPYSGGELGALDVLPGLKRNSHTTLQGFVAQLGGLAKSFSGVAHKSNKRQSTSTDVQAFSLSYKADATAAGSGSTLGTLETTGSSASTVLFSVAAAVAAVVALLF